MAVATGRASTWKRYAWATGILFVVALVGEVVVAGGIPINQDDSAAKIATALHEHDTRLLAIAGLSVVYAAAFVVYLSQLHDLLRRSTDLAPALPRSSWWAACSR
jgi:hypothetical protein